MSDSIKTLIENYRTPTRAVELVNKTNVILLVGISGAGKDTILKELLKTNRFHYIVSHTTRKPRENHGVLEQDGIDYHFIDTDQAVKMLKAGEFVEAKFYSGNVYGTSIKEFEAAKTEHLTAITDIEVQGVEEYMKISSTVIPIFILPPGYDVWQQRINNRYVGGVVNSEDRALRINTAIKELNQALDSDYYQYVINDDLENTVDIILEIADGHLSSKKNQEAKSVAVGLLDALKNIQ